MEVRYHSSGYRMRPFYDGLPLANIISRLFSAIRNFLWTGDIGGGHRGMVSCLRSAFTCSNESGLSLAHASVLFGLLRSRVGIPSNLRYLFSQQVSDSLYVMSLPLSKSHLRKGLGNDATSTQAKGRVRKARKAEVTKAPTETNKPAPPCIDEYFFMEAPRCKQHLQIQQVPCCVHSFREDSEESLSSSVNAFYKATQRLEAGKASYFNNSTNEAK
ncbi:somatostatin receptor type 4 [Striga asiatica]|uniref:Somatostatin receptor type 4 n=1 Tax=Striga asiatica TaxID=4170 RepID=A0A5A7QJW0_STRAF|nr:somatostatin receptor type 4 [Striga asiatica]